MTVDDDATFKYEVGKTIQKLKIYSAVRCFKVIKKSYWSESLWRAHALVPIKLTISNIILKNGQTYFKRLAVSRPQDFKSMFGHFLV